MIRWFYGSGGEGKRVLALLSCLLLWGCGERTEDVRDEVVSFSQTSRIRGLDPAVSGEVSSSMAISKIYEGLLQYDYLAPHSYNASSKYKEVADTAPSAQFAAYTDPTPAAPPPPHHNPLPPAPSTDHETHLIPQSGY